MESNLTALTENKRAHLLNIFKHDVTRLYWDLGKAINDCFKRENTIAKEQKTRAANEKTFAQDKILFEVAENIRPVFGDLLNYDNLHKMRALHKQYKVTMLPSQSLFDIPNQLAEYFGKNGSQFRELMEPTLDFSPELDEIIADNAISQEIIFQIYRKVMLFQLVLNQYVFTEFNNLYWEAGVELLKGPQTRSAENLPFPLNEMELPHCKAFAQIYANNWEHGNLTSQVPWEYIKLLIKVGDTKDQARIAAQVILYHVPITTLKKQIEKASFNPKVGLDTSNLLLPDRAQITKTVEVTEQGHRMTIETNRWPNFYNKFHHNIYANKTLLKFLKTE